MPDDVWTGAEWLDREDALSRAGRLERIEWLATLLPDAEYLVYPGGILSKYLFEELRYCFAYGQFIATAMLGLAYIERTLASQLYATGRDDLERASISSLLREALLLGWITDEEFREIDEARPTP